MVEYETVLPSGDGGTKASPPPDSWGVWALASSGAAGSGRKPLGAPPTKTAAKRPTEPTKSAGTREAFATMPSRLIDLAATVTMNEKSFDILHLAYLSPSGSVS